jgi:hypothetical protein
MKQHLNANHLKMIAILAMTVDHIADLIYPGFPADPAALGMNIVGRLTAPIMWFFLCEGFFYTRNLRRYMGRMLLFAVISHFAYCFAFGISCIPFRDGIFSQTSVIWPLFWALAALWVVYSENRLRVWQKWALVILIDVITFPADWSCVAVMAIVSMYENRGRFRKQMTGMMLWVTVYCVISFLFVDRVYALVQLGVILVCPLLRTYNGKKGKATWMKWFFYLYYPAHLIVVGLFRLAIYGNISLLF